MLIRNYFYVILCCILVGPLFSNAQGNYDSAAIDHRFKKVNHILNILRDFRFKAIVQPEWQRADTVGVTSTQSTAFPAAANNRFLLRQGRFILGWEHEIENKHGDTIKVGQFNLNVNINEKGVTSLFEFYGRIIDPWTGWFSLKAGIFTTPFGFETPDPIDIHESPEQDQVSGNIFPMESDLGGELLIESPRSFKPFYLRVDAGVINGDGIQVNGEKGAYQSHKDFVSRIWFGKFWKLGEGSSIGFNASVSYYNGGVLQTDTGVYEVMKNGAGVPVFSNIVSGTVEGSLNGWQNKVYEFGRDYYGAHLQVNYDYKIRSNFSALTMLRGEFITGTQPGQAATNQAPNGAGATGSGIPNVNLYIRKFNGGAVYVQEGFNFYAGKQLMHTDLTFKYDFYNPNTQVSGQQVIAANGFSTADMSWQTVSGGIAFVPVPAFKLVLWYDHEVNESTGLAGWKTNNAKDNIFTIRTQFLIDSWWWDKRTNNPNLIMKQY